ncbi:WD repeat-containing and planar cell polarity effector protein fritz like [Crotalus adamanteus]|uniref:WD repeat-containing and planar cell polarity effector protein fritz like n=1 Tax=Crotalus adamanteus TaxID=8729 RepID=A0AAW1C9R6_CROAD
MHLWSVKSNLYVEDKDIGVYQYHEKNEPEPQIKVGYLYEKQQFAESRNYPWVLKNKRPEKLQDTLKELEELMQNSQCVLSKWKRKDVCQLLFSSGILVSLSLSGPQLEEVVIDRALMGKFISNTISDAVLTDTFMIFSFWEQSKLCFIQSSKKANSPDVNKRLEKLSNFDFKISYIDIPGLGNRRIKRYLTINNVQNMVICWWSTAKDELWPWSPVSCKRERANLLLLKCEHGNLEILNYIHTDGDPLDVRFSIFDKGPIGVLHFKTGITPRGQLGLVEIIQEYIHQDEIHEAINILNGMNWNTMGHHCYVSLCAIINYLLRQKLTHIREAQLEATLGTFYAPTRPLSETTVLAYRDQISRYARRFFHHLLRHQRFEKAFLLAVDIGARDLFMDIHYFALDKGELALAEVAKKKANNIDTESITTGVEIPRHKNTEDNLREPIVDLCMTPQEQKFEGSLLPCSTSDDFFKYMTSNSSTSEVDKRECKFLTDFCTKQEMDKTACQTEIFQEVHEEQQEIRGKSSIKVVHFGLV